VCDTFYLVRGPVTIYTRVPDETSIGETGDTVQVPAGQAHRVVNESDHDVATILIQGVGTYDFRPILEQRRPGVRPSVGRGTERAPPVPTRALMAHVSASINIPVSPDEIWQLRQSPSIERKPSCRSFM
jgi:hypothetical protein